MDTFPQVTKLSNEIKQLCSMNDNITCPTKNAITKWNAGINIIYYRDGKDKMGYHSDHAQNETTILVVNVSTSNEDRNHNTNNTNESCHHDRPRKVLIKTWKGNKHKSKLPSHADEIFELYIRPGDGYEMDGTFILLCSIHKRNAFYTKVFNPVFSFSSLYPPFQIILNNLI